MAFKEIKVKEIEENFIKNIADEWMLISAGNEGGYNMMTASWGFVGEMWGNDTVIAAVRPQRYTMEFIDKNDYFTLSFYGDKKDIHKVCGSLSGRDVNKTEMTGLTPVFTDNTVYFNEARLVLVCKKQYVAPLTESGFLDKEILDKWYNGDLHNMIFGKIEKVLVK
ncbi:MAG: flavin reductase family protein [Ruminococcaceae bacterium]|nr:flavin reductase family protein [Oscillospiraceae bacterium]